MLSPKVKITDIVYYSPKKNTYRMIDLKRQKYIGEMSVKERNDLYIERLFINEEEREKGYGKKFLDFATKLSEKANLGGRLRLLAAKLGFGTKKQPHIFYRKYGFESMYTDELNKIDECIKNNEPLPELFPPIYMTYNPKKK